MAALRVIEVWKLVHFFCILPEKVLGLLALQLVVTSHGSGESLVSHDALDQVMPVDAILDQD